MERSSSRLAGGRLARFVARFEWRLVLAILLIAAVLRLMNFLELNQSPALSWHHIPTTDMHFFDAWGQRIAEGDWIGREPFHPIHGWHEQVAGAAFGAEPDLRERVHATAGDASQVSATRELWNEWYGGPRFHQEPLYAYMIGLTYRTIATDVRVVFAWQTVMGMLVLLLIFVVTRSFFGSAPAIASLALAVAFGPLMFFETVLLRAVMISFTGLGLVMLWQRARKNPNWIRLFLLGAAAGLALYVKSVFVVFLGVLGTVWLVGILVQRKSIQARQVALVVAAFLAVLTPAVLRNRDVGASSFSFSSVGAATFAVSNTRSYAPSLGWAVQPEEVAAIMSAGSGNFGKTVVEAVRSQDSLAKYTVLLLRKAYYLLNWYEHPNNANYYYFRLHSRVLRFLPITFTIILPLAIVGLFAAVRRNRDSWPLLALVVTHVLAILATFVSARFRLPITCALIPFAGLGLYELGMWICERRYRLATVAAVGAGAFSLWLARETPASEHPIPVADYNIAHPIYYDVLAREAESRGDYSGIAAIYSRALTVAPRVVTEFGANRLPTDTWELEVAEFYGRVLWSYGYALELAGRPADSHAAYRRAEVMRISAAQARAALGLPPVPQ